MKNTLIEQKSIYKERKRISKDLHDGVINSVFTLRFNLQQFDSNNENIKNGLIQELQALEAKIREISHTLGKKYTVAQTSFDNILMDLVKKQSNPFKTVFSLSIDEDAYLEDLTTSEKVTIYHLLQETLQNVNKHSFASKCLINIFTKDNKTIIKIYDNGIGFEPNAKLNSGINNLKERAKLIKAQLYIESDIENGTTITLEI